MGAIRTAEELLGSIVERVTRLERRLTRVPTAATIPPGLPAGALMPFGGAAAPAGYLICSGQSLTVAAYPDLFAAIGYLHGGSGANFSLPDMRGKVPVGVNSAETEFDVIGETGGAKTHTLTTPQMPSHSHGPVDATGGGFLRSGISSQGNYNWVGTGASFGVNSTTGLTGGGLPHNNLQPYIALHYIIKT